jgi:diaminopimelate epimerase
MNSIQFVKFQATGNDFIILDGRNQEYSSLPVAQMCNRKFGIGADGLMIIQPKEGYDFEMIYYNSDGNKSTMCGNGGRAIAKWASMLGIGNSNLSFWAPDGAHQAEIFESEVRLKMNDVSHYEFAKGKHSIINTGSPHYVSLARGDIFSESEGEFVQWAKSIRYSEPFKIEGINVNQMVIHDLRKLSMRTYERGVENETLSCGTGVTAAALTCALENNIQHGSIEVVTLGGKLRVEFSSSEKGFENIWLIGPAVQVFEGTYFL